MKQTDVPKIASIIRAFLITTGPRSAREISEFIEFNDFKLGKQSFSAQQISRFIKYNRYPRTILEDIQNTDTKPIKYFIPGGETYVRRENHC